MSRTRAIVDKLLTGVSNGYFPQGYIGDLIFPLIGNVKQSSGKIAKYGKEHLRLVSTIMGGANEARRITTRSESSTGYYIEDHGLEGLVTKSDYDNVEDPFEAEQDEVNGITHLLMIAREKAIADALTNPSTITQNTTLVGASQFSDYANSDPIGKFNTARADIYGSCGMTPNKAVMPWDVFNVLSFHPQLLELGFAQTRAGQLSIEEMKKILQVEELLVGKVKYNSASQGQTDVLSSVWGKHIVFLVAPNAPGKHQISCGYTVRKANESERQVFTYEPGNPPNAKAVIVTDNYDDVIVDAGAAYLIKDAVA